METKIYKFPEIKLEEVSCVYVGKPGKCMCGCSGKYTYTRLNRYVSSKARGYEVKDAEVNDHRVKRVLAKMRKNETSGIEVINDYIFTELVGKTQYSVYLKEN